MTQTLLELIDAYADARQSHGAECDYLKEVTELRAEIVDRLELINSYGGTEAGHIKAILATGASLAGFVAEPVDRWSAMIPNPHPRENCGPLMLALPVGSTCPTCGTKIE
jgi:hypothetical protein